MTDTRTPDVRLREAAKAAREALATVMTVQELARQAGNADLFAALEPARHAHGLVVAALTGDADTPEPGLTCDWCMRPLGEHTPPYTIHAHGWGVDPVCPNRAATHWSVRLATHPVEAPHD